MLGLLDVLHADAGREAPISVVPVARQVSAREPLVRIEAVHKEAERIDGIIGRAPGSTSVEEQVLR